MKVSIINHFNAQGNEYYEWDMWDGPDGIDHMHGYATDLIHAFSKIIEWREKVARDYVEGTLADLETLEQFIQNNETN